MIAAQALVREVTPADVARLNRASNTATVVFDDDSRLTVGEKLDFLARVVADVEGVYLSGGLTIVDHHHEAELSTSKTSSVSGNYGPSLTADQVAALVTAVPARIVRSATATAVVDRHARVQIGNTIELTYTSTLDVPTVDEDTLPDHVDGIEVAKAKPGERKLAVTVTDPTLDIEDLKLVLAELAAYLRTEVTNLDSLTLTDADENAQMYDEFAYRADRDR